MFEGIKKVIKENVVPFLPPSVQRLARDVQEIKDLPGDIIQDGQDQFEQMLHASPLGQAALEGLLRDKKKHIGRLDRGTSIIIEISDDRQDDLSPVRPDDVRALAATHLAQSAEIPPNRIRIRFTPKPPQR